MPTPTQNATAKAMQKAMHSATPTVTVPDSRQRAASQPRQKVPQAWIAAPR